MKTAATVSVYHFSSDKNLSCRGVYYLEKEKENKLYVKTHPGWQSCPGSMSSKASF